MLPASTTQPYHSCWSHPYVSNATTTRSYARTWTRILTHFERLNPLSMVLLAVVAASLAALPSAVNAQFPPTPEGITTVPSRFKNGVILSYKEVRIQVLHMMSKVAEEMRTPKLVYVECY
jgi:hypothetical protein